MPNAIEVVKSEVSQKTSGKLNGSEQEELINQIVFEMNEIGFEGDFESLVGTLINNSFIGL